MEERLLLGVIKECPACDKRIRELGILFMTCEGCMEIGFRSRMVRRNKDYVHPGLCDPCYLKRKRGK